MELPDIIKSDIIKEEWNALWYDIAELIKDISIKPILILSSSYQKGSEEEVQLEKMLHACKLEPEQYNILQLQETQKIAWHKLHEQLKPSKILLLGIHPMQIGISALFQINELNHFSDCLIVPTLSLSELKKQESVRSQLWNNALKPMFIESL